MRSLNEETSGSVYPIGLYIIYLGLASFFILILGEILEPVVNIMESSPLKTFFIAVFPKGLLIVTFIALTYRLYLKMQKKDYEVVA